METYMIQAGELRNENLINVKKKNKRAWSVKGVIDANKGNPGVEAKAFKKLMGL
jgi:hypothetical protein